jgi:cystathionine gamma-synthase
MPQPSKHRIETQAIHAGRAPDPATGAITPPLHLSTTFERDADGGYSKGYVYSRMGNPNRHSLETALAALEGGVEAAAFSSGLAAISAVFGSLQPGDHVIAPADIYHGTARQLVDLFQRWGLTACFVDMTDLQAVRQAVQPSTRLIWIETPSNPLIQCVDISALADIAHRNKALAVADNTFASPIMQQPLALGCDLVVHATTKYIGGHSDVLSGVVITREPCAFFEQVRTTQILGGAVPSPFDCWLLQRSLPTLAYRMRAHAEHALTVARFLHEHPAVDTVHYPGLESSPYHALARRQMLGFGGMLSFQIKGDQATAMHLLENLQLFTRATSLGGVESLIEHRASIEGPHSKTPANLLRVSVGLEHPDDLIDDLNNGLAHLH